MSAASAPEPPAPRTVGAGAAIVLFGQVASVVAGIALGVLIARLLGPEGTGAVNVVGSTIILLAALGSLGVGSGAQYFVSRGEWKVGDAVRQTQVAAVAIGAVLGAVGAVLALGPASGAFDHVPLAALLVGMAAVPLSLSWNFSSQAALGVNRQEPMVIATVGTVTVALVLTAILAPPLGVTGAVIAVTAGNLVVAALIQGPWLGRYIEPPSPGWLRQAPARLRHASGYGLRAYVPGALQIFNYRGDLVILSGTAAGATVGHYSIALSLALLAAMVPRALSLVTTSRVAGLGRDGGWEEEMVTRKAARHGVLIAIALGAGMAIVAPLIPIVYGSDFTPAVELALLLVPSSVAVALATVLYGVILGKGHPEYAMRAAIVTTIVAFSLYLTLIPAYEAHGAAIASSISQLVGCALTVFYFVRLAPEVGLSGMRPGREELAEYLALVRRSHRDAGRG